MPGLNPTARNAMLDATASVWPPDTTSLHTADPGDTNTPAAGEVSGGAYARQAVTWSGAALGVKSSDAEITFDVPGGTTITHLGYWRAATYLGSRPLDASQTFATAGTYTIAAGDIDENLT